MEWIKVLQQDQPLRNSFEEELMTRASQLMRRAALDAGSWEEVLQLRGEIKSLCYFLNQITATEREEKAYVDFLKERE